MARLGCCDNYELHLMDRCGKSTIAQLPFTQLQWCRELDDTSDASATIPLRGEDCCEDAAKIWPWCTELGVWRCGEIVWQGPVITAVHTPDEVSVTARDVTAWLDRRVIHRLDESTGDYADQALALIRDAFERDDPCVLPHVTKLSNADVRGRRTYCPNVDRAGEELRALAAAGVDFTTIGRAIYIFGEDKPIGQLPLLSDADFVGPLQVVVDGTLAVTRACVSTEETAEDLDAPEGATQCPRETCCASISNPPCGDLEWSITDDSADDREALCAQAKALVRGGETIPVYVVLDGNNSYLSPGAPVDINHLVPGSMMTVQSSATCFELSTDMRLTRVCATIDENGERVSLIGSPVGFATAEVETPGGI